MGVQFDVIQPPFIDKDLKIICKRWPCAKNDFEIVKNILKTRPEYGEKIHGLGSYRKIEIQITQINYSKKNGLRLITEPLLEQLRVVLWWLCAVSIDNKHGNKEIAKIIKDRLKQFVQ